MLRYVKFKFHYEKVFRAGVVQDIKWCGYGGQMVGSNQNGIRLVDHSYVTYNVFIFISLLESKSIVIFIKAGLKFVTVP